MMFPDDLMEIVVPAPEQNSKIPCYRHSNLQCKARLHDDIKSFILLGKIMFRKLILTTCACVGLAHAGFAQDNDEDARFTWANDYFAAGGTIVAQAKNLNDVFLVGDTVNNASDLLGSAHMAGRLVRVDAPISGNLYAMGQSIFVNAPIKGNLLAFGQTLSLDGSLGGNLRAAGKTIYLNQPISGSAIIAADSVVIASHIAGDLKIFSDDVRFSDTAKVDGKLEVSSGKASALENSANAPEQLRIITKDHWEDESDQTEQGLISWLIDALQGIALTTALVGVLVIIFPHWMSHKGGILVQAPFGAVWSGILSLAVILGLMLVLLLSIIGAFTLPLFVIFGFFVFWLGSLVATYGIGVFVLGKFGSFDSSRVLERVSASLIGAVVVFCIFQIPYIWFFACLALGFAGLGVVMWPFISRKLPIGPTFS